MHGPPYPPPAKKPGMHWVIIGLLGVVAALLLLLVAVLAFTLNRGADPATPRPSSSVLESQNPGSGAQEAPLADSYTGNSLNNTAEEIGLDGAAELTLRFTHKDPQDLRGNIEVVGRQVSGTGLFNGTLSGNQITLDIHPTDGAPAFQLIGLVAADGSISGALKVRGSGYILEQSGRWTVRPE